MRDVAGARVLVAGMGKSGVAAAKLLRSKGARVILTDQKPVSVDVLPQTIETFVNADLIVLSPGVPVDIPEVLQAKQKGIAVIGEVELAGWYLQGPVIGVTGANGKTTTTSLIGHILERSGIPCQVGGNIGLPPTAMIEGSKPDQWNVLELSSFQLETIETFRVNIGVALNVTPDHLDRHHTMENYIAAKGQMFRRQTADDFAVLNADDAACISYASLTPGKPLWFSITHPVSPGLWRDGHRLMFDNELMMLAHEIPLPGTHNIENTLAAAGAARLAGANLRQIGAAVRSFPGVEHRLEFVRDHNGVKYYTDSKATNVDATQKAVDSFAGGLWIILGGKDKGSDYTVLREALTLKARGALLIGAAANKIAAQLDGGPPLIHCGTLDQAVEYASRRAQRGDIVLLAPACASFDQFENYEQRGRVFKQLVMAL
jgi:UDP-N-acetylmuramoylalanine--D-glutamate ligase